MSTHTTGATAPSAALLPHNAPSSVSEPPSEMTGAQAGLTSHEQIRLVLEALVAGGGSATMADFYQAVSAAMTPHRLSPNGRAGLRCYVNRTCVKQGLVEADTVARRTAQWRITEAGRDLVQPPVPVPQPRDLREPLLKVLGRLTGYQPGVYVEMTDVLDDVIREAGFDPDNLPRGWDRTARSSGGNGAGIDRNISFAFRYGYRNSTPALTMKGDRAGQWGLTDHGIAHVKRLLPRPLPLPHTLHDPLLQVLGRLSNHTANVPFDQQAVYRAVMVEVGVDPDSLPPTWAERGSNRQVKALDCVRSAVKSLRSAVVPLLQQPARCQWALTEAGEAEARNLNGVAARPADKPAPAFKPKRRSGPNATSIWLGQHMNPNGQLYAMMRGALAKRLPVSANADMLDDHIQNFVMRAIRRDSFAKRLEDGGDIPYSKVVSYAVNSGRTDARDMGTEPVCREMYGARTERERRDQRDGEPQFGNTSGASWDTDGNVVPDEEDNAVIDDTTADFDELWREIERTVEDHKPQAWQRYASILAMKARGFSTREIAQAEGVSRNRAASMLAEARRVVREDYNAGVFADFF